MWLSWLEHQSSSNHNVVGSIPSLGAYDPWSRPVPEAANPGFSPARMFPSLKPMGKRQVRIFKTKKIRFVAHFESEQDLGTDSMYDVRKTVV